MDSLSTGLLFFTEYLDYSREHSIGEFENKHLHLGSGANSSDTAPTLTLGEVIFDGMVSP